MEKPKITEEKIVPLYETKFLSLYDLQYAEGRHYFDASRNRKENLAVLLDGEAIKKKCADAVTIFAIVCVPGEEPKLLLSYEYRYPIGQFLLSPPAGLIDPEDRKEEQPLVIATVRELHEETGIVVGEKDRIFEVNPLVWSTPGMTDESNALMCAVMHLENLDCLSQAGAEGTELFQGFELVGREEAKKILREGRDRFGNYYPVYTWCAISYFLSGAWEE